MRFLLILFLLILPLWSSRAQSPSYVHYGVREGLPSNKVYCALQDHRGFIWFGTDKGLVRFDGTRFQVYGAKDGLPDPEVLSLFEDSHQRLWISSFSHRPSYMLNGRIFTAKTDSLLAKINIEASLWEFSEDSAQRIWLVGRSNYAFVFDGKSVTVDTFPESTFRMAQIGTLHFALGNGSVMQKDIGLHFKIKDFPGLSTSIAASNNYILSALPNQLILLEWINGQVIERDRVACTEGRLFKDRKNRFWHCTDSKGAICFNNFRHDLSQQDQYLPEEHVNGMMEDNHGTLWFCTDGHGVFALSPGKAATYTKADGLAMNNITAIARNQFGQLLAGDGSGNFYRFTNQTIQKTILNPAQDFDRCRQIIALGGDTCWAAYDKGLFYKTGTTFRKITPPRGNFSGFKTIMLRQKQLWYGNHHALGYVPTDTLQPVLVMNIRTTALGQDALGNIWAGRLSGLYNQVDQFRYNWGDRFPELKSRIVAVENAGSNKIWVATPASGLLLGTVVNGELVDIQPINQYIKRPIENIQSIFVEKTAGGRVWMATNSGVYGVRPTDWNVVHYDTYDGLADNDVNCVFVSNDTLWAGTPAGLSFFPLLFQSGTSDFGTYITGLQYQSQGHPVFVSLLDSFPPAHRIVLPPDAIMVTLNLAGLNYRNQDNLAYECVTTKTLPPVWWWTRYNLFNWVKNNFRSITDTTIIDNGSYHFGISLPSGSYQMKITAYTTHGMYSEYPDYWKIVMRPYWYNTVWFDLFLWGVLAYIIWRIFRVRLEYRKLNIAVSELQLQALQSQINPHFVGNSINAIQQFFYPPNPAAASNYIELFTRLLRRTIILSEKHFNPFEAELAYDHDYLKMIQLRFGDRFQYHIIGAESVPGNLPFPSMLLQPLLENATIHGLAPEGISRLTMQFSYENNKLQCVITDNGMGYKTSRARATSNPVEQKSKGLEMLEKKVVAFNQLYDMGLRLELTDLSESKPPGMGTMVTTSFDPGKIH